jgi:toxin ParE1/3/4
MTFRFSTEAELDLADIFEAGEILFGRVQAERYLLALLDSFSTIATQPRMAPQRNVGGVEVRVHPHGSHVILYDIDDLGVLILRVRHAREDWRNDGPA